MIKMLKKLTIICIILALLPIYSCKSKTSAREIMENFVKAYPLEGRVYFSDSEEWEEGYISDSLFCDAFIWEGDLPEDFALMLNLSVDKPVECGVFYASDAALRDRITESCLERIGIICEGEYSLAFCRGFVFYAVLPDTARAEELFYTLVK